jgi:hypothetical protein
MAFGQVDARMLGLRHHFQVFGPVVTLVAVLVMHDFAGL